MLNRRNFLTAATGVAAAAGLAACAKEDGSTTASSSGGGSKAITLGFSQVGSESGWRTANSDSVKSAAKEAGYTLKFSDAQQKQENQISAIRNYIAQKVDVIAFSPVVVTGWDAVLKEAKAAKIPVVLTDRSVETSDDSLFVTLVGSDFTDEGRRAAKILEKVLEKAGHKGPVKIAQLEGTTGAAPAIERAKGFKEVMDADHADDWKIVVSQTGDFTRAGGKQVMAAFLQSNPDIDVLFAHNDDMGIGAIQAIEAAGKKPGKDILIVTVDGVKDGFVAMSEGKINAIVECNPLLGPQLMEVVKKVHNGTVNTAARVALRAGLPLAVLPGGTLNHFAYDLGVEDVRDLARALRQGDAVRVDVGRYSCGGQQGIFLNTCSVGVYPELVRERERWAHRVGGWPAGVLAALRVLRTGRHPLEAEFQGRTRPLWLLFAGNGTYHRMGVASGRRRDLADGQLDVRVVHGGRRPAARLLAAALAGPLTRSPAHAAVQVGRLRLDQVAPGTLLAYDGEVIEVEGRVTLEKLPEALTVYRPIAGY